MQASRTLQFLLLIGILFAILLMVQNFTQPRTQITISELEQNIRDGEVEKLTFLKSANEIQGRYRKDSAAARAKKTESFTAITDQDYYNNVIIPLARTADVDFGMQNPSPWASIFSPTVLLLILCIAAPVLILFWMINRQVQNSGSNQAINFGKSRARLAADGKRRITFADVSGVEEAVEELREVVDFLREPRKYEALGAEIPKGVLLVGPPGCGKTHLAKAVAGEANVPFFYISGSDFVEMFVGVGASRVRDLFDQAKRRAPCLVFIDELDAVGRHRGTGIGGTHDEREQTLNQMLVEMDGFEPNSGIIVLAATNRPDVLDPALLRPGRFDRRIVVDSPDLNGRKGILQIYVKNKPLANDVDLEDIAQRTPGFSGADLKNVVNEAALLAARTGASKINGGHFFEAVDRVVAGPERKSRIINEKERLVIAYHELGHAIVGHQLDHSDPVHKISILPRGQALGYTLQFPAEDRFLVSKNQILDRVSVLLGGRAAEELVFGEVTTGASNDLQRSTQMVRDLITKYGMSEALGPIQFGNQHENPFLGRSVMEDRNYSDEIAYKIDEEVKKIVTECYQRAKEVLTRLRGRMDEIAQVLIKKEHLNKDEFDALMRGESLDGGAGPEPSEPGSMAPATTGTVTPQPPAKPTISPAPAG
ncbi:ATP-dependent zinc metalloprotease FtsH [bacterium]|nr:ATP-dependent zinc metalloprotease FtsH [bacterium]